MARTQGTEALLFLHVHKTGGQTFNQVLHRMHRSDASYSVHPDAWRDWPAFTDRFGELPEAQRRALSLLEGHMYFGLHEQLPQGARYVTFLREPRERTISLFNFIRRNPRVGPVHQEVVDNRLDLAGYLAAGLHLPADNGQTRFVSGVSDRPYGQCDRSMLEIAKRNLEESFLLAGLLERFDECLLLLQDLLGWRAPWYQPVNIAPASGPPEPLSPAALAEIDRYNDLDQELYLFARARLDVLLREKEDALRARVRRFRRELVFYRLARRAKRRGLGLIEAVRTRTGLIPPAPTNG